MHYLKSLFVLFFLVFHLVANAQSATSADQLNSPSSRLLQTQKQYENALTDGDSSEIAEVSYLLGKRYMALGNYAKAQQWLLKSLTARSISGPSESIGKIYLRMSEIQCIQKDAAQTKFYCNLAILNFKKAGSMKGLMSGYRAIGNAYYLEWKTTPFKTDEVTMLLDQAIFYLERSLKISKYLKIRVDEALTYQSLSHTWQSKGDRRQSLFYKQKALELYESEKLVNSIIEIYTEMGTDYLSNNKSDSAKIWLDKARVLANRPQSSTHGLLVSLEEAFTSYYEQTGQWEKALWHQKKTNELKSRQFEQYRNEAISNTNFAYESDIKSNQIAAQLKENILNKKNLQIQNRLTIAIIILFFGAGFAGVLFYLLFLKYRKISVQNALLVQEQNHRTKNNLQSVTNLLSLQLYRLSDPLAVKVMEESLLRVEAITLVHSNLYQGNNLLAIDMAAYVPDLITSVLRTYNVGHTHTIYEIDELWLHTDKAISLGLIVNELATNACKYALQHHPDPELIIHLALISGEISFTFMDNGPGFKTRSDTNSFGLKLIGLLTEKLKAKSKFSTENGCCFELSFSAGLRDHHQVLTNQFA